MNQLKPFRTLRDSAWPRLHRPRPGDWELVRHIRAAAQPLREAPERALADRSRQLRDLVVGGRSCLDLEILVPAGALVCEAIRRTLAQELYDVQLMAGLVLATGAVAEMQTGEGKTLAAALPAYLGALAGRGVHVATVNSYLARRDCQLLRAAYELLALRVGRLDESDHARKRDAYACDITYGTGYELGFDFLRDQRSARSRPRRALGEAFRLGLRGDFQRSDPPLQRGLELVIIDEIDSVLLDEANTPLILSGEVPGHTVSVEPYHRAREVADRLVPDRHFTRAEGSRPLSLTIEGAAAIFADPDLLPGGSLLRPWSSYVEQALQALYGLRKDTDYVVREGQVLLVDPYTGRIFAERTWRDGLHQAVEAREGVAITAEKRAVARISRQRYFQQYARICGMTGTARGHQGEFHQFYRLPVVVIPTRLPCRRVELADRYLGTAAAKWAAIAREAARRHAAGQPLLVATRTIRDSHLLADELRSAGVPHQLLNGVQDADEASIIAGAGQAGAVTIATNMAGRGTDIKLTAAARESGGLHVIGGEHHDSRRVDRQLAGRAARQGDPGSCQFFVSGDDALLRRFAPRLSRALQQIGPRPGGLGRGYASALRRAQRRAERHSYRQRCRLCQQEQWLDDLLRSIAEPTESRPPQPAWT